MNKTISTSLAQTALKNILAKVTLANRTLVSEDIVGICTFCDLDPEPFLTDQRTLRYLRAPVKKEAVSMYRLEGRTMGEVSKTLHGDDDFTLEEAAKVVGLSPGTLRSYVSNLGVYYGMGEYHGQPPDLFEVRRVKDGKLVYPHRLTKPQLLAQAKSK